MMTMIREAYPNELYHHGVKGQKWGVRRYQNPDGSLTDAGKKRYTSMSSKDLQNELTKNIKKARKEKYDFSNRFSWRSTIGPESKKALDNYLSKKSDNDKTEDSIAFQKKLSKLNRQSENMSDEEWKTKANKIYEDYYKTESGKEFIRLSSYRVLDGDGWKRGKEYANSYGKDITVGYLKDLGFDEAGSKFIADILAKDNRSLG